VRRILLALTMLAVMLLVPSTARAATTQRIVLVGDSITAGGLVVGPDRLDAQLGYRLPGVTVLNRGIGGECLVGCTGTNLVDTLPPVLATMQPGDVLVVDIGMNNLWSYPGDAVWTGAYNQVTAAATAAGVHWLAGDITPLGSANWPRELLRQQLNTWLHDVAGPHAVRYSDVLHCTEGSCAGQSWADPRVGWPDGVHISDGGYDLMANLLVSQLHSLGWVT
jgi:lysophospholipase L1-like esterase